MKRSILPLVTGLLVSFGCGALPGQDVDYEPTPMPVVRALLELADVGPQDLVTISDPGTAVSRSPRHVSLARGASGLRSIRTGHAGAREGT